MNNSFLENRPVISDYGAVSEYLHSVFEWKKRNTPAFSIRKAIGEGRGCSPALVTQVLKGKRSLTLERVPQFASILGLTRTEARQLERRVKAERVLGSAPEAERVISRSRKRSGPQNHLLQDWLNVYVKDLFGLKSSRSDLNSVHRALSTIASRERVARSLSFLLKNGYLRKTLQGAIVKNEHLVQTTDDLPNQKIRSFHKQALSIAKNGIDLYPPERRRASALTIALTDEGADELRELLKEFYERLMTFTETHASDEGKLYQVLMHLTPIGGFHD